MGLPIAIGLGAQEKLPGQKNGVGSGKKNAPPPPDYQGLAEQQADASAKLLQQQTQANRPNQHNAFGAEVNWTQNPDGTWAQNQSFGSGPLGQAAQGLQAQAAANMATPFSFAQFGELGTGDDARNQAIDSAYKQATSRLDPMWQQREEAQRTQLLNQGLTPGTEAFNQQMALMGRDRNDAYTSALNMAIGHGTAAGDSVFRNNLMGRQQGISEALQQRSMPTQELQALMGFLGMPGFQGAGMSEAPQLLPAGIAQGNYGMQAWQGQNQANADYWQGLLNLLKSGAMAAGGL